MSERVLVTGASGFTGRHLAAKLLQCGYTVRALVRGGGTHDELRDAGCEVVFGDLGTGEGIEPAVAGVHAVYHIAAAFRKEFVARQEFTRVNVEGTRRLLDAALKYSVWRFVHCSTVGVHGEIHGPPANEQHPLLPGDAYQRSKLEGEELARSYGRRGLGVVVIRPTGIYGPGDLRFLKVFKAVSRGRWFSLGKAQKLYHLTYIDDLIDGILLCGTTKGIEGEVFILAGEEYCTVTELALMIAGILERPLKVHVIPVAPVWMAARFCETIFPLMNLEPPLYTRRLDFFLKDRAFDASKAKRTLGFRPRINLVEGLRRTAEWYRGQGWL